MKAPMFHRSFSRFPLKLPRHFAYPLQMKKARSHQVDEAAQLCFRNLLPKTWVSNEQRNDYGIDYVVQTADRDGNLTGNSFFVQLKGQERCAVVNAGQEIRFRLEAKHLVHYADRIKDLPVFLCVVETTSGAGWWLFLQQYLHENKAWRNRASSSVKLPTANELRDSTLLATAVSRAKEWLRRRYPLSVQESLNAHARLIEELDPRFRAIVTTDGGRVGFRLNAVEPLSLRVVTSTEESVRRFQSLVLRGGEEVFSPGEVTLKGSPIFDERPHGALSVKAGFTYAIRIRLSALDAQGTEVGVLHAPGTLTGGTAEIGFDAGLERAPFRLTVSGICPEGRPAQCRLHCDLSRWDGQDLSILAYYRDLSSFFARLSSAVRYELEVERDGVSMFEMECGEALVPHALLISDVFSVIDKLRRVVSRIGLTCNWSFELLQNDQLGALDELYDVLFGGVRRLPDPGARLAFTTRDASQIQEWRNVVKPAGLKLVGARSYKILGKLVIVDPVETELSEMLFESAAEDSASAAGPNAGVEVVFAGSLSTVISIRAGDAGPTVEVVQDEFMPSTPLL